LAESDFDSTIIRTISERFNRDDVEVSLEWVPDNSFYTYHVDVTPQPGFRMNLRRNSIRLKVEYNILYNVSIVKVSPCGQMVTVLDEIYYGECHIRDHDLIVTSIVNESSVVVFNLPFSDTLYNNTAIHSVQSIYNASPMI
jgi:hypothetical protein